MGKCNLAMGQIVRRVACVVVGALSLVLSACVGTEHTLVIKPSDTLDVRDYSGAYVSFVPLDGDAPKGGRMRGPETYYFDRITRGVYRFARRQDDESTAEFVGYLSVLDVGSEKEALLALNGEAEQGTLLLLAREDRAGNVEVFLMRQDDDRKLAELAALAERFGLRAEVGSGKILGSPSAAVLRAAFVDRAFLENIELQLIGSFTRLSGKQSWPGDVALKAGQDDSSSNNSGSEDVPKPISLTGMPSRSWNLLEREARGETIVCAAVHGDTGLRLERYRTPTKVPVKGYVTDTIISVPVPISRVKELAEVTAGDNYDRQNIEAQVVSVEFGLNLDFHVSLELRMDGGWYGLDWFLTKSPGYRASALTDTVLVSTKINEEFLFNVIEQAEFAVATIEGSLVDDLILRAEFHDLNTAVVNLDRCLSG